MEQDVARIAEQARDRETEAYNQCYFEEEAPEDRALIDDFLFHYTDKEFHNDLGEYLTADKECSLKIREALRELREWENLGMTTGRDFKTAVDAGTAAACIEARFRNIGLAVYAAMLKNTGEIE